MFIRQSFYTFFPNWFSNTFLPATPGAHFFSLFRDVIVAPQIPWQNRSNRFDRFCPRLTHITTLVGFFFVCIRRVSALVKTLAGMSSAIWQTPRVGFVAKTFLSGYRAQLGRRRVSALVKTAARVSSAIWETPRVGFS